MVRDGRGMPTTIVLHFAALIAGTLAGLAWWDETPAEPSTINHQPLWAPLRARHPAASGDEGRQDRSHIPQRCAARLADRERPGRVRL